MKDIKHELQNIIIGNGQEGNTSQLKKVHDFLRGNENTGSKPEKQKYLKSEEEQLLIRFAEKEKLFFSTEISEDLFISEGAEQGVYRFDAHSVIKLNGSIFYEYWLDYFNSLLVHNYFFRSTYTSRKHNPNVPDIPNKLIKPPLRNNLLKQRRDFWDLVIHHNGPVKWNKSAITLRQSVY